MRRLFSIIILLLYYVSGTYGNCVRFCSGNHFESKVQSNITLHTTGIKMVSMRTSDVINELKQNINAFDDFIHISLSQTTSISLNLPIHSTNDDVKIALKHLICNPTQVCTLKNTIVGRRLNTLPSTFILTRTLLENDIIT